MPTLVRRWLPPIALFAITALTTTYCGAFWAGVPVSVFELPEVVRAGLLGEVLRRGLPFSATILSILLAHELGHFFAARRHGVASTPPYFIPMPLLIGTMGAVIRMRGRIPNRRALVDIAAAGPWAGFVVAVPALVAGLSWSEWKPLPPASGTFPSGSIVELVRLMMGAVPEPAGVLQEGSSLIYYGLVTSVAGRAPAGMGLYLHPVAMAAWFGLFVTGLNLLPVGQLDGGHVVYALIGERARAVGRVVIGLLVVLGIFCWAGWWLWALIGWKFVGTRHPPVVDEAERMGRARGVVAWASVVLFVLTCVPIPIELR